ncbi:MAG: DMT family transporter [Oligoflexales bacterium]
MTIPYVGELASLSAAFIWSFTLTAYRAYGTKISAIHLNLYKNLVAFVCLVVLMVATAAQWSLSMRSFVYLCISGLFGLSLGDSFLMAALKRVGTQLSSSVQCLAPPLSGLLAIFWLSENLSTMEWIGLVLTVLAIFLLIYFSQNKKRRVADIPTKTLWSGIAFALAAALCQAFSWVIARDALQSVDVLAGTLIRIGAGGVVLLIYSVWRRDTTYRNIFTDFSLFWRLSLAAFFGSFIGVTLLSIGAKYTKAGVSAALASTYPIWIIPVAYFMVKERATVLSVFCTVVAVVGISLMFLA